MKIKLLASAQQDLLDGYGFYEQQAKGIGEYFLDSLYSDIDSLIVIAGIHPKIHPCISPCGPCRKRTFKIDPVNFSEPGTAILIRSKSTNKKTTARVV